MILTLFFIGVCLISIPVILRRPGRKISPRLWTRLCASSLITGAVIITTGGTVSSLATFFALIGEHQVAHDCQVMFGDPFRENSLVSFVALSLIPLTLILGLRSLVHCRRVARRAWVEPEVGDHMVLDHNVELVVVEDTLPRAFSVPGEGSRKSQVVFTTGLLESLSKDQIDVVRAHEMAHLESRHGRYLATAVVVNAMFWFWPPVYLATAELRLALERSADESSVQQAGHLRSVLRSALVRLALGADAPALAAFSSLAGLSCRLDAMDRQTAKGESLGSWTIIVLSLAGISIAAIFSLSQISHGGLCLLSMLHECAN